MKPTRRTATAFGYAPPSCDHASRWRAKGHGIRRCSGCGTERTDSYESLRLPLPALTTQSGCPDELQAPGYGRAFAVGQLHCQFGVARPAGGRRSREGREERPGGPAMGPPGRQAEGQRATGRWRG
ncbi:DUF6255 family natural product biosynthesis protein [Streptomyces sp. NPDC050610]|uniref:DUF6255 family natural product biosynthesis protein n=1 Tax=Streptomyces sp. NPDC050610 TaxID=3157097 RepID=UPI00343AC625